MAETRAQPAETVLQIATMGTVAAGRRVALDRGLLAAVAGGRRGPTLHFYRLRPTVLIGRHQWPEAEARLDWCRARSVAVRRRLTGGGALYVDEGQVVFTLVVPRPAAAAENLLAAVLGQACRAVQRGLGRLGVAAAVKPPNDIEVRERKLASVFAVIDGPACLIHGTVLRDIEVEAMLLALRVPTEKLSADGRAGARQRLTTLGDALTPTPDEGAIQSAIAAGIVRTFGFAGTVVADGNDAAAAAAASKAAAPDLETPYEAFLPCDPGALRVRLWLDVGGRAVKRAAVAADGMVDPPDILDRLAAALPGTAVAVVRDAVAGFLDHTPCDFVGFGRAQVVDAFAAAADRPAQERAFALGPGEANALMVHDPNGIGFAAIAARASVMLVPYCAKLVDCKWRARDGCPACGLCEVGDAYGLSQAHGLRAISIQNHEHLCRTLSQLAAEKVSAFVGMCCGQFYLRRFRAFRDAGIPALLINIAGANCYELHEEEQAYAGDFAAKSILDIPVLRKVLGAAVRPASSACPRWRPRCGLPG